MRCRPCRRRALDASSKYQGVLEALDGVLVSEGGERTSVTFQPRAVRTDALLVVQSNDAELVDDKRIVPADFLRGKQVLLGERDVGESEMLHPDEQEREVRAGQVALRRRISRNRLVVLAFVRERVGVREPGRAEARVDEDGFPARVAVSFAATRTRGTPNAPKEAPRLFPAFAGKVPQPDCVPADRVVRLVLDHLVREEEQPGSQVRDVVHAGEVEREGRAVVRVERDDAARR